MQITKSCAMFRNFIKSPAKITIAEQEIMVQLGYKDDNPYLLDAHYDDIDIPVPWLGKRLLIIIN